VGALESAHALTFRPPPAARHPSYNLLKSMIGTMTELDEIAQKYADGRLDHIKSDLERFITANRVRIDGLKQEWATRRHVQLTDENAIKQFILKHRSINPVAEIQEQLEEIQKEKWIRGVQQGCEPDEQAVALEWSQKYSANWRAHRVTTIIYVFDREKERYVKLFGDGREGPANQSA